MTGRYSLIRLCLIVGLALALIAPVPPHSVPVHAGSLSPATDDYIPHAPDDSPGNSGPTHPFEPPAGGSGDVDEIIVHFRDDLLSSASAAGLHRALGAVPVAHSQRGGFEVVRVPKGRAVAGLIQEYTESGLVEYAEPNYPFATLWEPNDELYPLQWHFDQVNAVEAWAIEQGGSADIIVAVLDTGVAYETRGSFLQAPDLAETRFVDGWDFINNNQWANDDRGHGTHVAGTIAQSTNNEIGVAGLAFGVSVMPVKVLGSSGSGTLATVSQGIYYAVDNGAHVINMSLGGTSLGSTLQNALDYAYANGVTVVAAAGNSYSRGSPPHYPAAYETTIAVGATRYDMTRAPYSNVGNYVDLVAPGGDTTVDQNDDGHPDGVLQQTFARNGAIDSFEYRYMQGTSMATPHVAAAAALLLSRNPDLSPDEVRHILQSTARDLGAPGRDPYYGHGLLDVEAALQLVVTAPEVATGTASNTGTGTATLSGTLVQDGQGVCKVGFLYGTSSGGPYTEATEWQPGFATDQEFSAVLTNLSPGTTYYYLAQASNQAGTGYGDEAVFTTRPHAPGDFAASRYDDASVDLSWSQGEGSATTLIRVSGDGYPADLNDGDPLYEGGETIFRHGPLPPGATYYYRAWSFALDHEGAHVWCDFAATPTVTWTSPPLGPIELNVDDVGSHSVTLSWTLGEGADAMHLRVKESPWAADDDSAAGNLVYEGPADSFTHGPLDPETTWYYRAWSLATDVDGNGVWSDGWVEAEATTGEGGELAHVAVPLHAGWNMISVPLDLMEFGCPTRVFADAAAVYTWDATARRYALVHPESAYFSVIEPGRGYWVAIPFAVPGFVMSGLPLTDPLEQQDQLLPGWNLVGCTSHTEGMSVANYFTGLGNGASQARAMYHWDGTAYVEAEELRPGRAYWLAAS